MRNAQLADLLRPQTIDDIAGQKHLFGERGVIRRMMEGGRITNMSSTELLMIYRRVKDIK